MHNNYFFLKQFSAALRRKIKGWQVASCFSQERDELVIGLTNGEEEFFLRATLTSHFSAVSTAGTFHRARRNTIDLFEPLIGAKVLDVVQHLNERSFYFKLSTGRQLLFKLFGNRANIALIENDKPKLIFNHQLKNDWDLRLSQMDRPLDFSREHFMQSELELPKLYPTLGDLALLYLNQQGYPDLPKPQQWQLLQALFGLLDSPATYRIIGLNNQTRLSLLPMGEPLAEYPDPLEALNQFVRLFLSRQGFERLYGQWHQRLSKALQHASRFVTKNRRELAELENKKSYSQLADVIMANLHQIPAKASQVTLFNFYTDQQVTVALKTTETPQKLAERYYRKAKQQPMQIQRLRQAIEAKEKEVEKLELSLLELEEIKDYKALKAFVQTLETEVVAAAKPETSLPFKRYRHMGFEIWVGRSAKNNDLLTQKYAHKDDLWLHAKDVAGSHVVIRQQAGKNFPEPVLQMAAQLAAYHSKRKTDSLCPVSYTPKKYVRKRKGAAAGQVVVEREKVLLVVPSEFQELALN